MDYMHTTAGAGPLTDFEIGQRVMTKEGYPGTVTDLHEGPGDLTTIWVSLDHNMGGGEYAEAELQPLSQSTGSRPTAAIATADLDYPELGTILTDRPPLEITRTSAKTAAVPLDCADCGDTYFTDSLDELHGCHRTALTLTDITARPSALPEGLTEAHAAGYAEGRDHARTGEPTRNPSEPYDPDFAVGYDLGWADGLSTSAPIDGNSDWARGLEDDQTASFTPESPLGAFEAGALREWLDENSAPGHPVSYDWCRFRRQAQCWLPYGLNQPASDEAGYAVWKPMNRGSCWRAKWDAQKACTTSAPGPNAGGFTDATVAWEDGGQRDGRPTPETPDPTKYTINTVPGGIVASRHEAALQTEASWRDIQAKAKRIRSAGWVRIIAAKDNVIVGHIRGDNGVYETEITSTPGRRNAAAYACGCKWASYSWGRSGPWKKYEGRMCSHSLALMYEAQSRGWGRKAITPDESQPSWMSDSKVYEYGDYNKDTGKYASVAVPTLFALGGISGDVLRTRLRGATNLHQAAKIMLNIARAEEPQVVRDLTAIAESTHGEFVGLDFRFKGMVSLLRKMRDESVLMRTPGETAMLMSDSLRFTLLFTPAEYTASSKAVISALKSRGYSVRTKNYWARGDDYNGINLALLTPTGHPVEVQLHTEASFRVKDKINHPIYEKLREEDDPNQKAIYGYQMMMNADAVQRPPGALSIDDRRNHPRTPYKDIDWFGRKSTLDLAEPGAIFLAVQRPTDTADDPEVVGLAKITVTGAWVWLAGAWERHDALLKWRYFGTAHTEEISAAEANQIAPMLDTRLTPVTEEF